MKGRRRSDVAVFLFFALLRNVATSFFGRLHPGPIFSLGSFPSVPKPSSLGKVSLFCFHISGDTLEEFVPSLVTIYTLPIWIHCLHFLVNRSKCCTPDTCRAMETPHGTSLRIV
ncbi:hypothetical protein FA15DRAFT_459883 [Coprinopsis marcescibilis]|uniref:Secreted protein n=1 Tax=Coprinopsis marcescibilis TaxID=230819 RepID=A0A5C3L5Y2_COPMA|nr:hypothetical protein FA15DRAFT_459883 [Coprinopsis marcescibilis]